MKIALIGVVTLLACASFGQERPNATQCKADGEKWSEQIRTNGSAAFDKSTYADLTTMGAEMFGCTATDPRNTSTYDMVSTMLMDAELNRYEHFVRRHNLEIQFRSEDVQGAR